MEYVSLEGLRLDGRRPKETRQIRCQMSVLPNADGSALFEAGNTKVLAAVYGPREAANRSQSLHDRALVQCEFSMASFATGERRRRTKGDRKSVEMGLVIKQALETAMITELLPRSQAWERRNGLCFLGAAQKHLVSCTVQCTCRALGYLSS
jgi:exosome complex component RRP41